VVCWVLLSRNPTYEYGNLLTGLDITPSPHLLTLRNPQNFDEIFSIKNFLDPP